MDVCLLKNRQSQGFFFSHKYCLLFSLFVATEYRNWLFYYSLPCMKGIFDEEYHQHYALLVGGIVLLSGRSISPEQLEMAGDIWCILLSCMIHIMVSGVVLGVLT